MLVAVNDYYRGYLVLSPAGQKRLEGEVRACPAARHAPPKLRNLVRYTLPELFAAIDAQRFNADRFVRLARRIKTLHLQTPVLRRSATAYTAIAREAMKIPHVKIDHCDYLARWQAAGWGQKAQLQIHAQLYNDAGVDGRVVVSASRQARVPLSAQAKLGLPEPVEVLHLGSPAAEFFGFYVRAWKSTVAAEE